MQEFFQQIEGYNGLIALGVLVALLLWESLQPFLGFFRARWKRRVWHGIWNLLMGALNAVMIKGLFLAVWLWACGVAAEKEIGVLHLWSWPTWALPIVAVLSFDFWTYWWHRMSHRVKFLWLFHRVHHSDPHMDVTTANRFHFGEIFFSSIYRVFIIFFTGAEFWHIALYEGIMFPIVQMHHANVGVPAALDRFLRLFIVTPVMHKIHHSRYQPETDSNYTSLLSIWDRLFHSFRIRHDPEAIQLGLDGYDDPPKQHMLGMLRTPFERKRRTGP